MTYFGSWQISSWADAGEVYIHSVTKTYVGKEAKYDPF